MPKGKKAIGSASLKVPPGGQSHPVVEKILTALEPYAEGMARTIGHAGSAKRKGKGYRPGDVRAAQIGLEFLLSRTAGGADVLKEMFDKLRETQSVHDMEIPSFESTTGLEPPPPEEGEEIDVEILSGEEEDEEEDEDGVVTGLPTL